MPRPTRLNIAGLPQHVIQRGNNRQACFFKESDNLLYLNLLEEACRRHHCEVHAYVLMTNHVHLLITPQIPDGVSLVMRDLGRDYVRRFNRTHQRTGTLWEGRFRSSLVDHELYCLACYRYIELNPVRAGMVAQPGNYRWTSFRANALGAEDCLVTPHECWLALGSRDRDRRRAYLAIFEQAVDASHIEDIRYGVLKGLPTGSDRFRAEIEATLGLKLGNGKRGRPATRKGPDTF